MGIGILEAVQEEEGSLEDMRKTLLLLKEKLRRQSKLTLAWKTKFRDENRLVTKLKKEREEYLRTIQSQLLVFESHLKKSRKELDVIVQHKDDVIRRQHQLICSLTLSLIKREGHDDIKKILPDLKLERTPSELSKNKTYETVSKNNEKNEKDSQLNKDKKQSVVICSSKSDFESLNDSDSAIMMEDAYDSLIAIPVGKGEVKVMRSVSDALEIISRGVSSSLNNKANPGNQIRRPGHGSLSSTPSCSSEESDESPPSTITKHRTDHLNEEKLSNDILSLNNVSTNLPLSSSTPYQPIINSSERTQSCTPNVWEMSSFVCPKSDDSCDRNLCQSPSCLQCNSASTTPLASPSQTPSISPSTTPPTSPKLYSDEASVPSIAKTKYDYDSDATLSDGQSDDGDSGLGKHLPGFPRVAPAEKKPLFGSYEKLNDVDVSYLRKMPIKDEMIQVTYNRVMSNHRSVTKPKDVKYKRINKAKSRSLEELRGKLKSFDGRQSFMPNLRQSDA